MAASARKGEGAALVAASLVQHDSSGALFHFQLHPEIAFVTPASGSLAGGTHLTLTGTGFPPETSAETMDVRAGGRACVVVRTSATELVCQVRLGLDADITAVRTIGTISFRSTGPPVPITARVHSTPQRRFAVRT